MSTADELAQIDRNIEVAKKALDFNAALERLMANRDFKEVITEGYLKNEAVRLVHAKANANMQTPFYQAAITRDIDAIGSLAQYFNTVARSADMAMKGMQADEDMRVELLAEQGGL